MTKVHSILMIVAAMFLGGCPHSQWASVENATSLASWVNPVATVVHMTASFGRAMTDPENELQVQQHAEERNKESSPDQSQPGSPQTELK